MIKILLFLCVSSVLVACDMVTAQTSSATNVLGENEVIAILDESASQDNLMRAADANGYQLLRATPLPSLGKVLLVYEKPDDVTAAEAIAILESAEPLSTVGVNHVYRLQQSNAAALDPKNYAQALIQWPNKSCPAQMPVGLIDALVDPNALGVKNAKVVSRHFGRGKAVASSHGTEVASILADPRRVNGLTIYNASVMSRSENGEQLAGVYALIKALDWMASQNIRVVNMSLAGPHNKILEIAVYQATAQGLIIVASVGNFGSNAGPYYPAAFAPVIATTAVDARRRIYRKAVQGAFVDVAAPGVDIFIPSASGGSFVSGTSIAAPFVASRMIVDPVFRKRQTADSVRNLLAQDSIDLGISGIDSTFGIGLLKGPSDC